MIVYEKPGWVITYCSDNRIRIFCNGRLLVKGPASDCDHRYPSLIETANLPEDILAIYTFFVGMTR